MNKLYYGGSGLPIEPREVKSVCREYNIQTTDGMSLCLVLDWDGPFMQVMYVNGEVEVVDRRFMGWERPLLPNGKPDWNANRPSQTHFYKTILSNLYGPVCMACGVPVQMNEDGITDNLTIDHVIPRAENGWSSLDNLQLLCKTCNVKKSDSYIDYRLMTPSEIFWLWADRYDKRVNG